MLAGGPPSHDDQTWATMAYVGQFVITVIAPVLVLVTKGRSPFVRQHAKQGINMGVAAVSIWVIGLLLHLAVEAVIFVPLAFTAATMFFLVRAAKAANNGTYQAVPPFIAWPLLK